MNIKEIKELIEMVDNSNLTMFEYENSGVKLTLKKEDNVVFAEPTKFVQSKADFTIANEYQKTEESSAKETKTIDPDLAQITSPIVGTFYSSPSPDSDVFVNVGDKVKKGDVLCIVEAMKLMNEITAEYDCKIEKILVKNEEMVEYGKPLFLVRPL